MAIHLINNAPSDIPKFVVATNCKYLCDGMLGLVYWWKRGNWCHNKGPMANPDLRAELLAAADWCSAQVSWVWVPSHVAIPRKE